MNLAWNWLLDGHSPAVGWSYLVNFGAPEDRNKGQLLFAEWAVEGGAGFRLAPRLERFVNQSDSAPAAYNGADYFHNNRTGWAARLRLELKTFGLQFDAGYVSAAPVNPSALASRSEAFFIGLETKYAEF
jgi:hypothetical protein